MTSWYSRCGTNYGAFTDDARAQFATDHRCNKDATTVVVRPDLQTTGPWGAVLSYEVRGCNAHDVVRCDEHRHGPDCKSVAFCENRTNSASISHHDRLSTANRG